MFLYIDPGTGSMLFAVIFGVIAAVTFAFQGLIIKLKSKVGVNTKDLTATNKLKYVIYSDHKRYAYLFKPVLDEFEKRKIEVNYWTQSPDDPILNENYEYVKSEFIGEGNKGFAKLNVMNAHICIATTPGLDVYQWKRSKMCDKYIHLEHGFGFCVGYRMFGLDFYDIVFTANDMSTKCIRELENKRNLKKKQIFAVGSPNLDYDLEKIKNLKLEKKDNINILVAPTWGNESLLKKYGTKLLDKLLDTGYHIILRPHPQSFTADKDTIEMIKEKYQDKLEFNQDNDNLNVMARADVLISDFSSIMLDYAFLFERPYLYYLSNESIDISIYDAGQLEDQSIWFSLKFNVGKELKEEDIEKLPLILKDIVDNKDKYRDNIIKYKQQAWTNIGKSGEVIVDNILSLE